MPEHTPPAHSTPMSAKTHSGVVLHRIEATSPDLKPIAANAYAIALEVACHSFHETVFQTPKCFSRIAACSPRALTAARKLFGIVSAIVNRAVAAIVVSPSLGAFDRGQRQVFFLFHRRSPRAPLSLAPR